jgi:hypothetical protein
MLQQPVTRDRLQRREWRTEPGLVPRVAEKSADFFSAWIKHLD